MENNLDKKTTRYLFTCIGSILYIMPCASCIALGGASEGFTFPFIFALIVTVLALPAGLLGMFAFRKKAYRFLVIAFDAVLIALHFACAFLVGTWYVIMAPAFLLYVLMIAWSDVIVNQPGNSQKKLK